MILLDRVTNENARTYAFRVLLHNIVKLELPPGTSISENELSALLQVSRTPVREALIELNKMELVTILPQRGSYVAKIDYGRIEESRFMRLTLEIAVLKLVCEEGISCHYLELLRENVKRQREFLADENSRLDILQLDNDFHRTLFEAADKTRTYQIIHSQMVHFDRLRFLSLKTVRDNKIVNDHENILYALERGDSELAEMIMTRHLTRHRLEKAELCAKYPDYFA